MSEQERGRQSPTRPIDALDELARELLLSAEVRLWKGREPVETAIVRGPGGERVFHFGRGGLVPEEQEEELRGAVAAVSAMRVCRLRILGRGEGGRRTLLSIAEEAGGSAAAWAVTFDRRDEGLAVGMWIRVAATSPHVVALRLMGPAA